jgi:small GTP-binding protein
VLKLQFRLDTFGRRPRCVEASRRFHGNQAARSSTAAGIAPLRSDKQLMASTDGRPVGAHATRQTLPSRLMCRDVRQLRPLAGRYRGDGQPMSGLEITHVRGELDGVLTELASLGGARDSPGLARGAAALTAKLEEQRFVVAVVGEFKRGKSTFINALLGSEVFPVGAVPVTAVVTTAAFGPVPRAEVTFEDGTSRMIGIDELPSFVTEGKNPGNRLDVAHVVVEHPAAPLAAGVRLVDTPGVGSIHHHNTDTTKRFLSEVDAAVFVTAADQPVSHTERLFLEEVRDHAARMFFVLNKIDILQPADAAEVLAFTTRALGEAVGQEVVIYPVSALSAFRAKQQANDAGVKASGLTRFEQDFGSFLVEEKTAVLTQSIATTAGRLAVDEINTVRVEQETLQRPLDELAHLVAGLTEVSDRAAESRRDLEALLEMETRQLVATVESDLGALRPAETQRLLTEALSLLEAHPNPRTAGEGLDNAVKESLRRSIDAWREAEAARIGELFRAATKRFAERTDDLVDRTTRLCSELLAIEVSAPPPGEPFAAESGFTFAFFDPPDSLEMTVAAIRRNAPNRLARKMLRSKLEEDIPLLVDKHCGRLRWDFYQRLEQGRIDVTGELATRLDDTLDSLQRGVDRARSQRIEPESDFAVLSAELDEALGRLDTLVRALDRIRSIADT